MRLLRFALCVAFLPLAAARAADDQKEEQQAPDEIPNFAQLDEYIYVPKTTLSLGARFFLRGPKTTYSGHGIVPSFVNPGGDATVGVPNISRTYIDGTVAPDARRITVNTGAGGATQVPIASDGRTNSWSYTSASQLQPDGSLAFHTYSGEITDNGSHVTSGKANAGIELIVDRDMGNIGKRMKWTLTAGFTIADIHSSVYASVPTTLTTVTDTYDLFGQVPPAPPFTSPTNISQSVVNSTGSQVQNVSESILLGNVPLGRTTVPTSVTSVNRYFIEGAYYTLRAGPTLIMPFGSRVKLTMSAGPALIYSGSVLNVLEDLTIATGQDFKYIYQKQNTRLLPGYYVDVDLQYQLTETAGFYMGGLYQGAGSYRQTVPSGGGLSYSTLINFGSQEGVKGGLTVRF